MIPEENNHCSMAMVSRDQAHVGHGDHGLIGHRDPGIPAQLVVRVQRRENEQGIPVQLVVRVRGYESKALLSRRGYGIKGASGTCATRYGKNSY